MTNKQYYKFLATVVDLTKPKYVLEYSGSFFTSSIVGNGSQAGALT
jgi:hypothetical protein